MICILLMLIWCNTWAMLGIPVSFWGKKHFRNIPIEYNYFFGLSFWVKSLKLLLCMLWRWLAKQVYIFQLKKRKKLWCVYLGGGEKERERGIIRGMINGYFINAASKAASERTVLADKWEWNWNEPGQSSVYKTWFQFPAVYVCLCTQESVNMKYKGRMLQSEQTTLQWWTISRVCLNYYFIFQFFFWLLLCCIKNRFCCWLLLLLQLCEWRRTFLMHSSIFMWVSKFNVM